MGKNTKKSYQRSRTIRSLIAILPLASLLVLGLVGVNATQGNIKTLQADLVSGTSSSCVPLSYIAPNLKTWCSYGTGLDTDYSFNVYGTGSNPLTSWSLMCNVYYMGADCEPSAGPANPHRNFVVTQIIGTWVEPYIAPNWDLAIWPGVEGGKPLGTSVANLVQAGTAGADIGAVWAENANNPGILLPLSTPPSGSIVKVILTRIHTSDWNIYLSVVFPNGYTATWDQNEPWTAAQTPATDNVSVTPPYQANDFWLEEYLPAFPQSNALLPGTIQPPACNVNWLTAQTTFRSVASGRSYTLSALPAINWVNNNDDVPMCSITGPNETIPSDPPPSPVDPISIGAPSYYTPIPPTRICDTRSNNPSNLSGQAAQCNGHSLQPNQPETIQVTGLGGVPSDATAVVINVTATNTQAPGYLTLYPAGTSPPTASNLNWTPGETVANQATIKLNSQGQLSMVSSAPTDAIIDVEGYYAPKGNGFTSITPTRICDTRPNNPSNLSGQAAQCNGHSLQPNQPETIQVTGLGGVPSDATAVVVNVTATNTQAPGYLTLYPAGTSPPTASNLNWTTGETVANQATIELNSQGQLSMVSSAPTDAIIDVEGYYASGGSAFYPIPPTRIVDTRLGNPSGLSGTALQYIGSPVYPKTPYHVYLSGLIPPLTTAAVLNVTVPSVLGGPGYLTVYPQGTPTPTASNLNWTPGEVVANQVTVGLGNTEEISFYTPQDFANLVVDLDGIFGPVPLTID